MTFKGDIKARVPGVLVPTALVASRDRFGGRTAGDCLAGDLILRGGRAVALAASDAQAQRLITPRFADPHVHLDKCHTADRLQAVGGDLDAAIAAQARDRNGWTAEDIRTRARTGLAELRAAGVGTVRSHVDWGASPDPGNVPMAWDILSDLASEAPDITLQRAALTSVDTMADPTYARGVAMRVARDGGVLGSFVFDQPDRAAGLANTFRAAEALGLALDFHVDEGLRSHLDGVEMIADAALETGFEGPVLIGHACSLMNLEGEDLARVVDKLALARISVAMLPFTNLYLQGRGPGTPDRRGLTRVHELRAAGVNVVLGADNVRDAFCPIGNHDPRQTLALAVTAAHLDPPLGRHLPMITTGAMTALGLAPRTVDGAAIGDLLSFDARSTTDLLAGGCLPQPLSVALSEHPA